MNIEKRHSKLFNEFITFGKTQGLHHIYYNGNTYLTNTDKVKDGHMTSSAYLKVEEKNHKVCVTVHCLYSRNIGGFTFVTYSNGKITDINDVFYKTYNACLDANVRNNTGELFVLETRENFTFEKEFLNIMKAMKALEYEAPKVPQELYEISELLNKINKQTDND